MKLNFIYLKQICAFMLDIDQKLWIIIYGLTKTMILVELKNPVTKEIKVSGDERKGFYP